MADDTHPEPIDEKRFAEKAGLAPQLVADLRRRQLTGGEDFTTKKNRVLLTLSGVRKLLAAVQADPGTADELAKKTAADGPVTLYVTRQCLNVRLLYAAPEKGSKEGSVTVRVRDNRQHPVGSEIRAYRPADGERMWRGLPRKKARLLS